VDDEFLTSSLRMRSFRRKKKHDGSDLDSLASSLDPIQKYGTADKGILCKECHKRIAWKELNIRYDTFGPDIFRIWVCSFCGTNVREENLTAKDDDDAD
jgi:hypothetical protein